MDPIHRKILRQRTRDLIDTLYTTDGFMAELIQSGIFSEEMIEIIEGEKTRSRKVYKILEILPTRGPTAFQTFVSLLKTDYEWLYNDLQDDLEEGMAQQQKVDNSANKEEKKQVQENISTFLNNKFGQSRKVPMNEIKSIGKWLDEYIREAQVRWEQSIIEREQLNKRMTVEEVEEIFSKIEIINMNLEMCFYNFDDKQVSSERRQVISGFSKQDAISHLNQNVNNLRRQFNNLTEECNKCHSFLHSPQDPEEAEPPIDRSNTCSSFGSTESKTLLEEIKQVTRGLEDKIQILKAEKVSLSQDFDSKVWEIKFENYDLQDEIQIKDDELSTFINEKLRLQQEVAELRNTVNTKEKQIDRQQRTINKLKNRAQQNKTNRLAYSNPSPITRKPFISTCSANIRCDNTRR